MTPRPTFFRARARLVPEADGPAPARRYRPLVSGPALLRRAPGTATWTVELACDRLLVPRAPRRATRVERPPRTVADRGATFRLAAAVAGPLDVAFRFGDHRRGGMTPSAPQRVNLDIYGWALMYQPPGMRGVALVDGDDRFGELPAMFELPLELIDRADFLEARGFRTRPLVIPTQPDDFVRGPDGRLCNRFFPEAVIRTPRGLDRLL